VFDVATAVVDKLNAIATPVREISGWTYQSNRDLTGFQDGTENPTLVDAPEIVLIPESEPGAGGSILLFQHEHGTIFVGFAKQWRHDGAAWRALPRETQERIIGRTKAESIELDESHMPADSHVTRTTLDESGKELKIFRRNTPYGCVGHARTDGWDWGRPIGGFLHLILGSTQFATIAALSSGCTASKKSRRPAVDPRLQGLNQSDRLALMISIPSCRDIDRAHSVGRQRSQTL